MPIVPDDKDWTWVLEQRCPECGFESSGLPADKIAPSISENAREWTSILGHDQELLRKRALEGRWSPLEYGCRVRDVFRLFDERLNLMLTIEHPQFQNWDQDRTAVEDDYPAQNPTAVAAQLSEAAGTIAPRFAGVAGAAWQRPGSRSNGSEFTVETLGRYMVQRRRTPSPRRQHRSGATVS